MLKQTIPFFFLVFQHVLLLYLCPLFPPTLSMPLLIFFHHVLCLSSENLIYQTLSHMTSQHHHILACINLYNLNLQKTIVFNATAVVFLAGPLWIKRHSSVHCWHLKWVIRGQSLQITGTFDVNLTCFPLSRFRILYQFLHYETICRKLTFYLAVFLSSCATTKTCK